MMNNKKLTTLAIVTFCSAGLSFASPNSSPSAEDLNTLSPKEQQVFFSEIVLHNSGVMPTTAKAQEKKEIISSTSKLTPLKKEKDRGISGSTGGRCLPYPDCKRPDF